MDTRTSTARRREARGDPPARTLRALRSSRGASRDHGTPRGRVVTVRDVALAANLLAACTSPLGDVRINELSPANKIGCPDAFGDSVDWIELFNATSHVIDLGGYHVFSDATTPDLTIIPTGVTIPPRGYLVLWADDKQKG